MLATPTGIAGPGTVNVAETALNVCPVGGVLITAPDQLLLKSVFFFLMSELMPWIPFAGATCLGRDWWLRASRLWTRFMRPGAASSVGAASVVAMRTLLRRISENFMMNVRFKNSNFKKRVKKKKKVKNDKRGNQS